ncbi:MAG: endonuclease/exonuclease/phosphatase family protein [Oscillospiraceae bacterium]
MTTAIKIASFNLKRDSRFARSNLWDTRKELIGKMIEESGAVVIGVQELLPSMEDDLRLMLADYSVFGFGRTKHLTNEESAILIKGRDTDVKFNKTFWLSKHPEKYGSRAFLSMFPRVCTVCEVYIQSLHRRIRVFNTHFDHVSFVARALSAHIILEYMHKLNTIEKLPTILMGDLNAKPNSKPIRILSENLHNYDDIKLTSIYSTFEEGTVRNTYHGFKGKYKEKPIDYMFVSEEFDIENAYIDTTDIDGRYPSDHFPLVAILRLKKNQSSSS